jgi:predicted RNA-binding Zn-ribbon protein involved in translation (DUF1610 family)
MKSIKTPECSCPSCGKVFDMASNLFGRAKPKLGDISVCISCGHIMAFNADMTCLNLTDAEMVEIAGNPRILQIQKARQTIEDYKRKR